MPRKAVDTIPSPKDEFSRRIERVQKDLKKRKLDAMIVFDRYNTVYLTGLQCSYSFLFITPREAILLVDGRYIETARTGVRHCEVRLLREMRPSFVKLGKEFEPRRIGFEGETAWSMVEQWRQFFTGAEWSEAGEIIRALRIIKSPDEIRLIEKSARLNDHVFSRAVASLRPGMTEVDVRNIIRSEADAAGADGLSFETIVATGAMSSRPHYTPQLRTLTRGDLLLIDMGMMVDGYCSDMTRVVAIGMKPRPRLMKLYEAVLEAEEAALKAVAPGVPCRDIDAIARGILRRHKLEKNFTHGLGHGVGLEIHEQPRLNQRSEDVLRAGMVVTIEPGAYLPGHGGVRIEDLVAVTRNGAKVLSRSPKQFTVVDF